VYIITKISRVTAMMKNHQNILSSVAHMMTPLILKAWANLLKPLIGLEA